MPAFKRWTMRASTAAQARASLTTHVFRPGRGYVEYAPEGELLKTSPRLALVNGQTRGGNCLPAPDAKAGSRHLIKPPGGHPPIACAWIASERAWQPLNRDGKRMAFTADYLTSHGWQYLSPAP